MPPPGCRHGRHDRDNLLLPSISAVIGQSICARRGGPVLPTEEPEQATDLVMDSGRLADDQGGRQRPGDDSADRTGDPRRLPLPPPLRGAPQAGLVRRAELAGPRRRCGDAQQRDDQSELGPRDEPADGRASS